MNASFRTAFWAMCLGLTVPMVLFVGVELTTGSKARHATSLAAADRGISLRTHLAKCRRGTPRLRRAPDAGRWC